MCLSLGVQRPLFLDGRESGMWSLEFPPCARLSRLVVPPSRQCLWRPQLPNSSSVSHCGGRGGEVIGQSVTDQNIGPWDRVPTVPWLTVLLCISVPGPEPLLDAHELGAPPLRTPAQWVLGSFSVVSGTGCSSAPTPSMAGDWSGH